MTTLNSMLLILCQRLASLYPEQETQLQHAWWLLEYGTNLSRLELLCAVNINYADLLKKLDPLIVEHVEHHKPLAYIIGSVPFCGSTILIEPPLLIPRMETEEWVELLIDQLMPIQASLTKPLTILDVCSGSGCIAVALARAFPSAQIVAIDIEPRAVDLIKKNMIHNGVNNVTPLQSDLFAALDHSKQFDIVVANPPYITAEEYQLLDQSVKNWEDPKALFTDDDGFAIIKKIVADAPQYIRRNDVLCTHAIPQVMIEIGCSQGNIAKDVMHSAGYSNIIIQKDCAGKDRVIMGSVSYEEQSKT